MPHSHIQRLLEVKSNIQNFHKLGCVKQTLQKYSPLSLNALICDNYVCFCYTAGCICIYIIEGPIKDFDIMT